MAIYIVRGSDMTGDEPKCMDGVVRSSDTADFELRKAICISEVAQIKWLELRMNGCGRK